MHTVKLYRLGKVLWLMPSALLLAFVVWIALPFPSEWYASNSTITRLEDRNGALLFDLSSKDEGDAKALHRVSVFVLQAVVATEDRSFWWNPGFSPRGIVRAGIRNVQSGKVVQGGSSITQQFVRLQLQPGNRNLYYKFRELLLAIKTTVRMRKSEILKGYLMKSFYGAGAYGIEEASKTYFGKGSEQLTLSESALLVGLLNAPSSLNPYNNPESALKRRNHVLRSMFDQGFIGQFEYKEALEERIVYSFLKTPSAAPHFVSMVRNLKRESVGPSLRTTLDLSLQVDVERIVSHHIENLKDMNASSAAVVVLDVSHGDVLALVGSANFYDDSIDGQVNVADSARQPGSTLKPFTYAIALNQGMTAATTIADVGVLYRTQEGNPYTPRNYDYEDHGLVRVREALGNSYNIASVKVLEKIGVGSLLTLLQKLGISTLTRSPEHYGLALTLGSGEVTLLELVSAYSVFPNLGTARAPRLVLEQPVELRPTELKASTAWIITDILSDESARLKEFGANSPMKCSEQVAAKTGTTRNSRDNWTIGYTRNYVVGVWVGNANNEPMKGTSGITGAGPIFHDVMESVIDRYDIGRFEKPDSVVQKRICSLSGKLPGDLCKETMNEWFENETEPKDTDDMHHEFLIDKRNGLLASQSCNPAFVQKKVFIIHPPETREWALEAGLKDPPNVYSPLCSEAALPTQDREKSIRSLTITTPHHQSEFEMDPTIPDTSEKILLRASAGLGIQTVKWLVDGQVIGTTQSPTHELWWPLQHGSHTIRAEVGDVHETVQIFVTK